MLVVRKLILNNESITIIRGLSEEKNKVVANCCSERFELDSDAEIIITKNTEDLKNKSLAALKRLQYFLEGQEAVYDKDIYKGDFDEDIYLIRKMINEKYKD